jgi:hypothetical protein
VLGTSKLHANDVVKKAECHSTPDNYVFGSLPRQAWLAKLSLGNFRLALCSTRCTCLVVFPAKPGLEGMFGWLLFFAYNHRISELV